MARCSYTAEQLSRPGSRAAATRLKLQQDQDKRRQAAVEPTSSVSGTPNTPETTIPSAGTSQTPSDVRGTATVPKRKWVTVPIRRGKKLQPRTKTLATLNTVASLFYAGLVEWPEETDVSLLTGTPIPSVEDTVDLTAETFTKPVEVPQTLAAEKKLLHVRSSKLPSRRPTSQLVTLKQRERATLRKVLADGNLGTGLLLQVESFVERDINDLPAIERALGLRPVITSATGNCPEMAIAQAVADQVMVVQDTIFGEQYRL
uniref:Uncharacterized protein n=1 Tax=Peronospora matthiolae TaxID=2874970 RepID=A0AAV1T5S6_9STRA